MRVLENLTTSELLDRWRTELTAAGLVPADAWNPYLPANGLVDEAEARLGVTLPPSYREFLSLSDGWPRCGGFVATLRRCAEIAWFRDAEREWYEIWKGINDEDESFDVALMARALVVSGPGEQALLLDPDDIDRATGEWACFTFSNWAPGSGRVGSSFRDGLDKLYRDFLANNDVASPTRGEAADTVEQAYRAMLGGDLAARRLLDDKIRLNWRAQVLAAQFDAFGAGPHKTDLSDSVNHLWWNIAGVTADEALADDVLVNELIPLYVVRLVERGGTSVDHEIGRAPEAAAMRMRSIARAIDTDGGVLADFSYAPEFARSVSDVRVLIAAGDLNAAWEVLRAALPSWRPRSSNHVAPVGIYYDRELRRLLTPLPPPPSPISGFGADESGAVRYVVIQSVGRKPPEPGAEFSSVRPLRDGKQHSERCLEILRTPYQWIESV